MSLLQRELEGSDVSLVRQTGKLLMLELRDSVKILGLVKWWYTPVIPAREKWTQKAQELKASLGYFQLCLGTIWGQRGGSVVEHRYYSSRRLEFGPLYPCQTITVAHQAAHNCL